MASNAGKVPSLSRYGLRQPAAIHANLSSPSLVEQALIRKEGILTDTGSLMCLTGARTSRSPKDKYIVREASIEKQIDWGKVNIPIDASVFTRLVDLARAYLQHKDIFIQDCYVCADPRYRLNLRVIAEKAWQALFARCLFRRPSAEQLSTFDPEWTILAVPDLVFDPSIDRTHSDAAIILSFDKKTILIAGTHYAGEIKKSIFTLLNALLPQKGVLPMHCSANVSHQGEVALFFGLSGTGKTTLSADPDRHLIGDDEHGWSDQGVFNIEGGCYAKTIRLSEKGEPQIWSAIRFGSVLENVPVDPFTRMPDYQSEQYTENTRAAYPLEFIPNVEPSGMGGHPKNIFFLTFDAFGVLPPIAKLSAEQAMDYFLCGYTAKVAGTEAGVKEPQTTFSTCFGAPFLPLAPRVYANMLRDRLLQQKIPVWLINTGWTGGPYGVGQRMSLTHTRALLHAALDGRLHQVRFQTDPIFGLSVPLECADVPSNILQPRNTWADPQAYDAKAKELANALQKEFQKYH